MSFKDEDGQEGQRQYYVPNMDIKDYNVVIDGKNFFDHPIKNDLKTYDNIRKIATGQDDDYTNGCLLDYPYFKNYYQFIAIDLSKQKTTISFIIFWDFLMFCQIFLSAQVKRWAVIAYIHGIYELPHESPNYLRLRIFRNKQISGNCLNTMEW